jgi:hypothetical protein
MTDLRRPRLLDLFCGAGGAAMGYWRSGFNVTGDLWLGCFVDTVKRRLYICLVPCFPIVVQCPSRGRSV